jgi:hypothetical protein
MHLVITAGPPDIWVGLEPETGEEAIALEACACPGGVDERTRSACHRTASGVAVRLGFPVTLA